MLRNKVTVSVLLCSFIESYDFIVYAQLSLILGQVFFNVHSSYVNLLMGLGTFAIPFIVRPFGAMLFGYIGDRKGRKSSLVLSMILFLLSIFCMAFLPTPESIGIISPIILVIIRMIQGLAMSGEIGGLVLIIENVKYDKVAIASAMHGIAIVCGGILAYVVISLCKNFLTEYEMLSYGWRIPFFIAFLMSLLLPYLRKSMEESHQYSEHIKVNQPSSFFSLLEAFIKYRKDCLLVYSITSLTSAMFYLVFVYIDIPQHVNIMNYIILMTIFIASYYCFAYFIGVKDSKISQLLAILVVIIFAYPTFYLMSYKFFFACIMSMILNAILFGIVFPIVVSIFPVAVRHTCFLVIYNIAHISGGIAPVVCLWMSNIVKLQAVPALYIIFWAIMAFICLLLYKGRNYMELRHLNG
ncbi:MFS transporter [Neoehrlichia mikurensis]|uniref:MFS transporter n=1 Tax=Neoehrlichia mikurensis TaxID=89586 RepID=A0A9Q9BRB7_9RICK|nr:MFS transporter [Neoehrlichia mikurensis]QXK92092.1 MFS transporter [Neoehrlichia mikurensis]QXK92549.1 MFS transporter [Neoehrlichia mikurensis]QXK93785.1 MFS transporter [Neoehrlichia mikurensis]UTO55240.1 MFS transporter [Neoehrlichia mikurensis]UTO56160.1 MFS transporter [Neoehrlichia mikurensis]